MHLLLLSILCCAAMALTDVFGTLLNISENTEGKLWDKLAGWSDVGVDFWGKCVLTAYGLETLTHGHGIVGWLFTIPVFATGFATTYFSKRYINRYRAKVTSCSHCGLIHQPGAFV